MNSFVRAKPSMEELEAAMAWQPPPVNIVGYQKLREGLAIASAWKQRLSVAVLDSQMTDLRVVEALVSEAHKIPVSLPEAKVLSTTQL